jgi:long-subunit fatty acid transport protein
VALVTGSSANAQETVLALEFDFSNPGARSMGFGNTFTALADDATAAFANPAGLTQLLRPEVSAEWRYWKYSTRYTSGGRLSGEPTGVGIDTSAGLRFEESSESLSGLSFLSFVYPKDRWSVAFFGHQLANFRFTSQTDGFIRDVQGPVPGGMERFPEQRAETEFEIITYGFAAAFQILDNLSIGLGLNYFDGNMDSRSTLYQALTVFDPHPFRAEDVQFSTLFEIDGSDLGMGVGVLWKMSDVWSWGGFYRQGPEFYISGTAIAGPRSGLPEGTQVFDASSPIAMPDTYGLGVAFRSKGGHLTLSFEWNRVEYASIVDSLDRDAFGLLPTLNDGDEFHFGGEYAFLNQEPVVALRIGVWLDPDHQLRATEDSPAMVRALRQPGDDEMHFAAGLGVAFSTFQIDLGVDLSDLVDTASLSMIYNF